MSYFQGGNRHVINYRELRGITAIPDAAAQRDGVPPWLQAELLSAPSPLHCHCPPRCPSTVPLPPPPSPLAAPAPSQAAAGRRSSSSVLGSRDDAGTDVGPSASSHGGEDMTTATTSIQVLGRSGIMGVTGPFLCRVSQDMPTAPRWLLVMSKMSLTVSLQTAGYCRSPQVRKLMEGL